MPAETYTFDMSHTVQWSELEEFDMVHTVSNAMSIVMQHSVKGPSAQSFLFPMQHTVSVSSSWLFPMQHSVVPLPVWDEIETFDMEHAVKGTEEFLFDMLHSTAIPSVYLIKMEHGVE